MNKRRYFVVKKKNVVIGTIGAAAAASATYLAAGRIAIEKVCTRRRKSWIKTSNE